MLGLITLLSLHHTVDDDKMKMKNHANEVGTVLAIARIMPAIC
jgi:hypothetical protein